MCFFLPERIAFLIWDTHISRTLFLPERMAFLICGPHISRWRTVLDVFLCFYLQICIMAFLYFELVVLKYKKDNLQILVFTHRKFSLGIALNFAF